METITITPKSGNVSTIVTVVGSGLEKGKKYDLNIEGIHTGTYRATPRGTLPANVTLTIPEIPAKGEKGEMGTKLQISLVAKGVKETNTTAQFELQASVKVETKLAYLGQSVKAEAKGLLPNDTYQLVMRTVMYRVFPVGILETDAKGAVATTIVIPGRLAPNAYKIDLIHKRNRYPAIRAPPSLTILGYSPDSLIADTPKIKSGTATNNASVSILFRNTTLTILMPVIYSIIYTPKKQPLLITSSAVAIPPKSKSEAYMPFGHLEKGNYLITTFATTATGHVISKMFSFPLIIRKRKKSPSSKSVAGAGRPLTLSVAQSDH